MRRYLFSLTAVGVLFFILSPDVASAGGFPGQVKQLEIVDKVDRDGDGKISDFKIKVSSKARTFNFPGKAVKTIKQATSKTFSAISDIPSKLISKLPIKLKMAPDICVSVRTQRLGEPILVEQGLTNEAEAKIEASNELMNKIKREEIDRIATIEAITNFKVKSIPRTLKRVAKMIRNKSLKELKESVEHPCGPSDITKIATPKVSGKIKVEPPSKDKLGRVRLTSKPDEVQMFVNDKHVGGTPLVADFPVDIGKVKLKAKKDGHKSKTKRVKFNPTGAAKQVVNVKLNKITKPIVIKSTPSNASININGGITANETPHTLQTWIKRSPTITVWNDDNSKTFRDINPPAVIEANLKQDQKRSSVVGTKLGSKYLRSPVNLGKVDYSDLIPPKLTLPPIEAKFGSVPTTTNISEKIEFDGSASYSLGGSIDSFNWEFGDGNTATGKQVDHTYSKSGKYTVKLTIVDSNGKTDVKKTRIKVTNQTPVAQFSTTKRKVAPGKDIKFNAAVSSDSEDSIDSYSWSFGDGNTAKGKQTAHRYVSPGEYKVELTVSDPQGQQASTIETIKVESKNRPPKAKIKLNSNKIGVDQKLKLNASQSKDPDGSIKKYDWLVGGKYLTGEKITHSFSSTGTKEVILSITDHNMEPNETSTTIEVVENEVQITKPDQQDKPDSEQGVIGSIITWIRSFFRQLVY